MQGKPTPSRTINPLHFEDLDPHRFEDLVRQLIHDFRSWSEIEALGRAGSDQGVDIRAVETNYEPEDEAGFDDEPDSETVDEMDSLTPSLRSWHFQCKRQKRIGPKKAEAIAAELLQSGDIPFGAVLVAPADFSKNTRDTFRSALLEFGVREVHLWGRAELEDMLFRPQNDHLLFAYFGISIQVRRRGLTNSLRRRLTTKRQLVRALGGPEEPRSYEQLLLRDPNEERYPHEDQIEQFSENPAWMGVNFADWHEPDFLPVTFQEFYAWFIRAKGHYDFVPECNLAGWRVLRRPWERQHQDDFCDRVRRYVNNGMPKENQARLEVIGWIHLDDILLVDEIGDSYHEPPHVLVQRKPRHGFFRHVRTFVNQNQRLHPVDELTRKNIFPDPIPEVSPPEPGSENW